MYCPTPGNSSISPLVLGNLPPRFAIAVDNLFKVSDLLFQSPIGFKSFFNLVLFTEDNDFQEGYCLMKKGKKVAIVSALVLCKRTSAIINWYLEEFFFRQGK
ncbi:hypothetical protein ES703_120698 [subsurface metagenome]